MIQSFDPTGVRATYKFGYLSNEISYRSIVLRNKLGSTIPTGHIHTPRISDFNAKTNQAIVEQIKAMLVLSLTEI